jgi:hypothetical protein
LLAVTPSDHPLYLRRVVSDNKAADPKFKTDKEKKDEA